ncbi:MAG: DinB family protein [Anaerolineales bacterium]|nr:DinB family protein [Anaerolineales bacterium]MCB9127847.1 DinB family protein [Ardenticatenales bacterium]
MIDFSPVERGEARFNEAIAAVTGADLAALTHEMIDEMLRRIDSATDSAVTLLPVDPKANDAFAVDASEVGLAWTLGHVIVHCTASAEESAALAAEQARGVVPKGRSRYEVPWETITTIAQCRARLEESRRMRIASLQMWPDQPHLAVVKEAWPGFEEVNAIGRFLLGLWHDSQHLGQISEIVRQAGDGE